MNATFDAFMMHKQLLHWEHLRAKTLFKNQGEEKIVLKVCTKEIIFISPELKHQWMQDTEPSLNPSPEAQNVLFSAAMPDLNCIVTITDFVEVLGEHCPVVQSHETMKQKGEQGYWKDIIHHMSDKLSSFTN